MDNRKEVFVDKSLIDALSYCHLRELPQEASKYDGIWIRAIAYVTKADTTKSYVLMDKSSNGSHRIIKDFGTISNIVNVRSIHPFQFVSEDSLPIFKGSNKQERIDWLTNNGVKIDGELTLKQLNNIVVNFVIQQELRNNKL